MPALRPTLPVVEIATTVVGSLYVSRMRTDDGYPVLVHAGSPGSRSMYAPAVAQAHARGLRLISYDRPGYGDSPPRPGRSIVDGAAATQAIADALGITRLAVYGFSGGGPYALACAALLPDLVRKCCVFASPSPEIRLGPEYERAAFTADHEALFARLMTVDGWLGVWGDAAETDDAHSRQLAEHLAGEQRAAMAHGDQGWWDDYNAIHRPWGFDPSTIRIPVQLWQGGRDRNVPPAHGHWLAEHIPGVDYHFLPDDDHATIEVDHRELCLRLARVGRVAPSSRRGDSGSELGRSVVGLRTRMQRHRLGEDRRVDVDAQRRRVHPDQATGRAEQ